LAIALRVAYRNARELDLEFSTVVFDGVAVELSAMVKHNALWNTNLVMMFFQMKDLICLALINLVGSASIHLVK
jgi:hypothetical protein